MGTISLLGLGILAGLHGALYGAYKDSPHESFLFRRFLREVAFALSGALALPVILPSVSHQSAFTVYLTLFALTRIVTEFWKLFLRVEPQGVFVSRHKCTASSVSCATRWCGCCSGLASLPRSTDSMRHSG